MCVTAALNWVKQSCGVLIFLFCFLVTEANFYVYSVEMLIEYYLEDYEARLIGRKISDVYVLNLTQIWFGK